MDEEQAIRTFGTRALGSFDRTIVSVVEEFAGVDPERLEQDGPTSALFLYLLRRAEKVLREERDSYERGAQLEG